MRWTKRIYYDDYSGEIIQETGGFESTLERYSVEYEISIYKTLSNRIRDTFDYIELENDEYAQDFAECNGYRVEPTTKQIKFSYPDPNKTEPSEPVYQESLSEQVTTLKQKNVILTDYVLDMDYRLIMIELLGGM